MGVYREVIVDIDIEIDDVLEYVESCHSTSELKQIKETVEDYERVQGLILTEEWLLKFGFEKIKTNNCIYWTLNNVDIWELNGGFANDLDIPIQYIHQLQNLYFALTNEELTAKED